MSVYLILFALVLIFFSFLLIKSVLAEALQRQELKRLTGQLRTAMADLRRRNRYFFALQEFATQIHSSDFPEITRQILDDLILKLGFIGGFLMLRDKDSDNIKIAAVTQTRLFSRALKYLPKPLSEYKGNYKIDNDLTALAMRTGRVQKGSDLHAFLGPDIPKGVAGLIQSLLRVRSVLAVPVEIEDKAAGCLLILSRQRKGDIDIIEIKMIQVLAAHIGLVLKK